MPDARYIAGMMRSCKPRLIGLQAASATCGRSRFGKTDSTGEFTAPARRGIEDCGDKKVMTCMTSCGKTGYGLGYYIPYTRRLNGSFSAKGIRPEAEKQTV